MSWHRLCKEEYQLLCSFLRPREYRAASLTERLFRLGSFAPPSKREGTVWILGDSGFEPGIRAMVMHCANGLLLPLFHRSHRPSLDEVKDLYKLMGARAGGIYCILGEKNDVLCCEAANGRSRRSERSFYLMTLGSTFPGGYSRGREIAGLEIVQIREQDSERFFPVELAYQLEEVVNDPASYNDQAGRIHFARQCRSQIIYGATVQGKPVAKLGTNAIGRDYCQIGGVYTLREYRRMGISRLLLQHLVRTITARKQKLCLYVRKDNEAAQGLYSSMGFRVRGEYRISYPS